MNEPRVAGKRSGQAKAKSHHAHHGSAHTHPHVVDALIDRAKSHPLGTEFLSQGSLDSVAAAFQAHAFTVEAARERLMGGGIAE
jgi:inosine-uridine nucleoside N-ribohydrolase